MTQPPIEPSANMRLFAKATWQMFTALLQEGFTEQQELSIVGVMLAASIGSPE